MRRSLKNTRPYKWIVQTFDLWIDTLSYAMTRISSGLFGGLFLILIVVQAQAQSLPYTKLVRGERSPYDTAVAIHLPTYRIETRKLKLADVVIDSLSSENESLRNERDKSESVINLQAANITVQGDQIKKSEVRWTELNNNYQQLFKLIQEKGEPEKWYQNKYLWIGAAFVSGVIIAR